MSRVVLSFSREAFPVAVVGCLEVLRHNDLAFTIPKPSLLDLASGEIDLQGPDAEEAAGLVEAFVEAYGY